MNYKQTIYLVKVRHNNYRWQSAKAIIKSFDDRKDHIDDPWSKIKLQFELYVDNCCCEYSSAYKWDLFDI